MKTKWSYIDGKSKPLKVIIWMLITFFVITLEVQQRKFNTISSDRFRTMIPIHPSRTADVKQNKKYLSSVLASNARLGNHLFEMVAIFAISQKLKRIPTFFIESNTHYQMLVDVDFLIPGLIDNFLIVNNTVPQNITSVNFGMKYAIFDNPDRLKNITDEHLHLKGVYYQCWKYFPRMRNKLIGFLKTTSNSFPDLPKSSGHNNVTCVHIRRTDFKDAGFYTPDKDYVLKAIQFVEDNEELKYNTTRATVFFSDDLEFVRELSREKLVLRNKSEKNLQKETYISMNDPYDSILYSKDHCDVVLFAAPRSTFGWWLGYLSKGNQVYYTDLKFVKDKTIAIGQFISEDYYPPHWTPIKYDNNLVVESL